MTVGIRDGIMIFSMLRSPFAEGGGSKRRWILRPFGCPFTVGTVSGF